MYIWYKEISHVPVGHPFEPVHKPLPSLFHSNCPTNLLEFDVGHYFYQIMNIQHVYRFVILQPMAMLIL